MSIFGISLIDNFGFDFISNFLREIRVIISSIAEYLSNTHFYSFITGLFYSKNVTNPEQSMIKENSWQTTKTQERTSENIGQNNRNSKISEWLKIEPEPEIIEESSNKNIMLSQHYLF